MSDPLKEFLTLQAEVERLKSEVDRRRGAYEQWLSRLQNEFGCKTLEAADLKLHRLERKSTKLDHQLSAAITEFRRKWKKELATSTS